MPTNDNPEATRQPNATNIVVHDAGENGTGSYFFVNGLRLYYEIHGESHGTDKPLVLLVGGLTTIDSTFGAVLTTLAKSRRIIVVE